MILDGGRSYRCARCGGTKALTTEHYYFDRHGRVSGYCKTCQGEVNRDYILSDVQRYRRRLHQRAYLRAKRGTPPDRWRVGPRPVSS